MEKEIWKDIDGYNGLYQVSNLGRVKSLNYNKTGIEKILKPKKSKLGYLSLWLYKKGSKRKDVRINRLVATAFLPNPNNYPVVNHKDENPQNNCVENLEWCTYQYNINYGNCKQKMSKGKYKPICQFSKDGTLIKIWDGAKQAADELNIDFRHISDCCKCKRKTAYGYKWHFYYKGIWLKKHIPLYNKKVV